MTILDYLIKAVAQPATNELIKQAQSNRTVIGLLKEWGLTPTPDKAPDSVYAYSFVDYRESKPEPILKVFKAKEIKDAFWEAFSSKDFFSFRKKVQDFIKRNSLGEKLREVNINLDVEIGEFILAYIKVIRRTMSVQDVISLKDIGIPEYSPYPDEFEALIKEKVRLFCGREFVFEEIQQFIYNNPNGYFTVVGDAGMGKSTIAAKYVFDNYRQSLCYFNIRSEGRNRPELFLKSLRQQLINRYWLQNATELDLPTLLQKVSDSLFDGDRLVIVVDALDEVDQESGGNLLYLPTALPSRVYFLLTRRPFNRENKRFSVSPGVPQKELDLRSQYIEKSREDVENHIWSFLRTEKYKNALNKWIEDRNIAAKEFVDQLAERSENNFMYLRCVLPAIVEGFYDNMSLDKLPIGLEGYYENHWQVMGMTSRPLPKDKIKIVYVMSALRRSASLEVIAKYSQQNQMKVQEVLDGWDQFLQKQENYKPSRYKFYHESFIDFLHRQDIVQAAGVSLPEISAEVAKSITGGIFGDG